MIPPKARTDTPRFDDSKVINGILYVLVTACRWMDMPNRYGSYKTSWDKFKGWSARGVWANVFKILFDKGCSMCKLSLDRVALDSTTIKAKKGGS